MNVTIFFDDFFKPADFFSRIGRELLKHNFGVCFFFKDLAKKLKNG